MNLSTSQPGPPAPWALADGGASGPLAPLGLDPSTWPRAARVLAWAAAGLGAAAVVWLPPRSEGVSARSKAGNPPLMHAAGTAVDAAELQGLKARHAALLAELARTPVFGTTPPSTEGVLLGLSQAVQRHGLTLELLRPGPLERHDGHALRPVAMRVLGRYADLAAFVGDVGTGLRTIGWVRLSLAPATAFPPTFPPATEAPRLAMDATLHLLEAPRASSPGTAAGQPQERQTVSPRRPGSSAGLAVPGPADQLPARLRPDPFDIGRLDSAPGAPGTTAAPKAPRTASAAARRTGPSGSPHDDDRPLIARLPLAEMTLVGVINRDGHALALLRAGGSLHAVGVGQAVGIEAARVERIDTQALTLGPAPKGLAGTGEARRVVLELQEER